MEFLKCIPTVFVIGSEYEILLISNNNGLLWLEIGGVKYYEENSGVLYTEKNIAKIRVAQSVLDSAKKYSVGFKRSVDRKQYYSILGEEERQEFSFSPVVCSEELNIYHFADIHGDFDIAETCIKAFEKRIDLIVFNGDIGEMQTEDDYYNICAFLGKMAQGSVPVVFTRGNHDTRGRLAEWYEKFFPCQNKKFFYTFTIGNLTGIVLDCGEDKVDSHIVYGGTNNFETYRREQLQFLRGLKSVDDTAWLVAITHICPVKTTRNKGDEFDIERELYTEWNKELERIGIHFVLSGHLHYHGVYCGEKDSDTLPHNYPVVIGSATKKDYLVGVGITLKKSCAEFVFTDSNGEKIDKYEEKKGGNVKRGYIAQDFEKS